MVPHRRPASGYGRHVAERAWSARHTSGSCHSLRSTRAFVTPTRTRISEKTRPRSGSQRALRLLVADGKLERYAIGIYQRPGFTMPEPASVELAAAAVVKFAKAEPGMRATASAALAGIESVKLWRATLELSPRAQARAYQRLQVCHAPPCALVRELL